MQALSCAGRRQGHILGRHSSFPSQLVAKGEIYPVVEHAGHPFTLQCSPVEAHIFLGFLLNFLTLSCKAPHVPSKHTKMGSSCHTSMQAAFVRKRG